MNMLDPNKIRFSNKNVTVVDLLALVPASLDVPVTEAELTAMVGLALVALDRRGADPESLGQVRL
jgi:hypothetical protein